MLLYVCVQRLGFVIENQLPKLGLLHSIQNPQSNVGTASHSSGMQKRTPAQRQGYLSTKNTKVNP